MSDNPFAEPDDDDRTVIIPRSALPLPADPGRPAPLDDAPTHDPAAVTAFPAGHGSPILTAAVPLLSLLSGLRNLASVPDPGRLRDSTVTAVRRYEQVLRDKAVPIDMIRMSHYALCASLDDVVQNTPWGSRGVWADASLVSTFHQEVRSGDRFFEVLTRLRESPARFLPLLELMYICMSLGMRGRYRLSPRGTAEHDRVREDTYLVILQQRGAAEKALSPRWRGVAAPYRVPGREVPLWLTALVAAGLVASLFAWVRLDLNRASDELFERALVLPPTAMPAIARPEPQKPIAPVVQPPGRLDVLARVLAPEIHAGRVTLTGTQAVPVIRLQSAGMFASGRANLLDSVIPLLDHIATALGSDPGPVHVIGYTDDRPVRTVAFPSNYQLSLARARAAAAVLGHGMDASRITVEGRADADPIAPNATEAERQLNRRVEIICGAA